MTSLGYGNSLRTDFTVHLSSLQINHKTSSILFPRQLYVVTKDLRVKTLVSSASETKERVLDTSQRVLKDVVKVGGTHNEVMEE